MPRERIACLGFNVRRVTAHFHVREGDSPAYGLAGSGARMPKMWQMASVSLARLSVQKWNSSTQRRVAAGIARERWWPRAPRAARDWQPTLRRRWPARPGHGPPRTPDVQSPWTDVRPQTSSAAPCECPSAFPCALMMVFGLPRPERPQVCGRGVPRRGQRLQNAVQLRHLGGREVPARRFGIGGDLLGVGDAGNDAAHLGMSQ
jgi:hypothetical protein